MTSSLETLPGKSDDHVVEVRLGHVITTFSVLVGSVLTTGLAIVLARDYSRYRRQNYSPDKYSRSDASFQGSSYLTSGKEENGSATAGHYPGCRRSEAGGSDTARRTRGDSKAFR